MSSLSLQLFAVGVVSLLMHDVCCSTYQNKLVVDCLNRPDNTGKFFINTFFADTSRGWRAQPLRGVCTPGSFVIFNLNEMIGYVWIKGESSAKAYFKVTSQQTVNGVYMHETWSYKGRTAFIVTSGDIMGASAPTFPGFPGFPLFSKCDKDDGINRNGYCELAGPNQTPLTTTKIPYSGTVYDISLAPVSTFTAFTGLTYTGITKGGAIHGYYWDYRNGKWNSDDCYTFTAHFSDGHSFEVTCPTKDFTSMSDSSSQASGMLSYLGQVPKYARSWLRTIAVNGGGPGSRAGANSGRKSMTVNLSKNIRSAAYKLFLHEGAHVGLLYIQNSPKWKTAKTLDPNYISTYAQSSPDHEDVAESYVCWVEVKRHPYSAQSSKIRKVIPNRLAVFDDLVLSKYH